MNENEIFTELLKLPGDQREAYLNHVCAEDEELAQRIRELLQAHQAKIESTRVYNPAQQAESDPTSDWDQSHPVQESNQDADSGIEKTKLVVPGSPEDKLIKGDELSSGDLIGPYQLLKPLGQGGMGEVWMAEQSEPVKRRVALKVIKRGIGSREILARFEAERQALSLMNHPNIARILDAGATPDGQPYFAMELVTGRPLTSYCDENRLSIDERLGLFTDVCNGVQHAHQKGIIHRDLKPGNILVGMIDGKPVAKVIDFGLAKAMESTPRLTDESLFTGIGQILGTLKYMSPEQASLDVVDIDTRTDIYALGVILYELMTGSTPLDDSSIKGQAALKILGIIRDKEPVKPSSRLGSSTDEQKSSITNHRRTDIARLNRVLAGDLDWIVMKALEKDRTRRYESASGFAADIHRYLNSEPVVARPPSLNYRVRKFVRKNRLGVVAASLVTVALVGGILGTSLALFRALKAESLAEERSGEANRARDEEAKQRALAEERRKDAEREKEVAEARRVEAEQNLAYAQKGNEILGSVFEGLDPSADYSTAAELRNALRDNLENAVTQLEGSAIGDPSVVLEMQSRLSNSLLGLGEASQAIVLFERALQTATKQFGPEHPITNAVMNNLAVGYHHAGYPDKATPLFEKVLERVDVSLGPQNSGRLTIQCNLAECYLATGQLERALSLFEQTLEQQKVTLGINHKDTLNSMQGLASCYYTAGQYDEAVPLYEQTLELKKENLGLHHPETLKSMNGLALGYHGAGQLDKALPLFEQTLELMNVELGTDHPDTLTVAGNAALCYQASGQLEKAVSMSRRTLELITAKLGPDHPNTLVAMNNLSTSYLKSRQPYNALPLLEQTLELTEAKLGPEHPSTLTSMNNLAECYKSVQEFEQALPLFERTLELSNLVLGSDHPTTLTVTSNLAQCYESAEQSERAIPLLERMLELNSAKLGPNAPKTLESMGSLASAYSSAGQPEKALPIHEQTLQMMKANLGPSHLSTLVAMNNMAVSYRAAGQSEKALALYEQTLEQMKANLGPDDPNTLNTATNLAVVYSDDGQFEKMLSVLTSEYGLEYPETMHRVCEVAHNYRDRDQPKKAVELLEAILAQFNAKLGPEHSNTVSCMSRLAEALKHDGQLERAWPLWHEALELSRTKLGPDDPVTVEVMSDLARAHKHDGQHEKAATMYAEIMDLEKAKRGSQHPLTFSAMTDVAESYMDAGQLDKAAPLYAEIWKMRKSDLGANHPSTLSTLGELISAYARTGNQEDFNKLLPQVLQQSLMSSSMENPHWAAILARTGWCLMEFKRPEDAEYLLSESLTIRQAKEPDAWTTFNTQSMLGGALLARYAVSGDGEERAKFLADAEPLLVAGYEGMKRREASIPPHSSARLREALDRLIELYTIMQKPDEVKKYSDLRAAYPKAEETEQ
jgi:serine/threonine protein kinase/tetratricopeptide (TPR) repeat protein